MDEDIPVPADDRETMRKFDRHSQKLQELYHAFCAWESWLIGAGKTDYDGELRLQLGEAQSVLSDCLFRRDYQRAMKVIACQMRVTDAAFRQLMRPLDN